MKKSKHIALLLCIALCFIMFFSVVFIVMEADHDCTGANCSICIEIQSCTSVLKSVAAIGISIAVFAPIFLNLCGFRIFGFEHRSHTLISLKVKLTN